MWPGQPTMASVMQAADIQMDLNGVSLISDLKLTADDMVDPPLTGCRSSCTSTEHFALDFRCTLKA